MAIYMTCESGTTSGNMKISPKISGTVSQKHHAGWIALTSCKLPTEREGVNTAPGKVTDRTTTQVDFKDVEIAKTMDKASPDLMKWNISGATYKVKIAVCKENGEELLKLELSDTLLTNYDSDVDEEGKIEETLAMDYTKIAMTFTTYNKDSKADVPQTIVYDLETASGS